MLSQMIRFHSFLWPSNILLYICTTTFKYTGWHFVILFVKSGGPTAKGCWLKLGLCWQLPGLEKPASEARNRMTSSGAGHWDFEATWNPVLLAYGEGHKGHVARGNPDILLFSVVGQEGALALGRAPQGHTKSSGRILPERLGSPECGFRNLWSHSCLDSRYHSCLNASSCKMGLITPTSQVSGED